MPVKFNTTAEESRKIAAILQRAEEVGITLSEDRLHHHMNLSACHANGCPLDFDKLASFDTFNLAHDLHGIDKHINRDTGKLWGFFLPRCSAPRP